ncbi:branched-chain amino acid aminotransferase [Actinoplanes sp. NPDC049316]|uniref:branched-chain amino acid aminotransferase n=1 Tax=Actinoplanes sp. NPDC049316 TaxID=3154727 RepID=UPI0034155ACB
MIDFATAPGGHRLAAGERDRALDIPGFGQVFTDHMVTMRWSEHSGWHDGRLEPYGPFTLPPSTSVFHYGQAVFEGMKAYRQAGGSLALFRPEANAERFNRSARRLAMPGLPPEVFVRAVELLVTQDRNWVPQGEGRSLYLRPFMIATQPGLGFTHPSSSYLFCVIASPATPYFGPAGPRALTVWLCEDYVRAAPGGTGEAKAAGNYAAAFAAGRQAVAHGCDQVVWLDAAERARVEEMGGMNLFFVYGGERPRLLTPELTGALLPGITRDSLLTLAGDLGMDAGEGRITAAQWREECEAARLTETFACGTAAVIAPVGTVRSASGGWQVGDGNPGPVMRRLRTELLDIQYGRVPDPHRWMHKVD